MRQEVLPQGNRVYQAHAGLGARPSKHNGSHGRAVAVFPVWQHQVVEVAAGQPKKRVPLPGLGHPHEFSLHGRLNRH